jgi:AcrR family transcriptional regulator
MSQNERAGYHHGNLREALIETGLDLTRRGGPDALAMREVTRLLGVSPTAAYRHFTDRDDLLGAIARRIHELMAQRMRSHLSPPSDESVDAAATLARDRLRAVGLGYVTFALAEPGWFEVAFASANAFRPPEEDAPLAPPLGMLVAALDALTVAGVLGATARRGAEWSCWSAVHGFAMLALHGPLRFQADDLVREAAERTVDDIVAGVLRDGDGFS